MNDDFLRQHRQAPPDQFAKTLYQQISNDELIAPPRVAPVRKSAYRLRAIAAAVAAVLVIATVGIVTLQSLNHPAATQLTQIDTGLLLDDLPPITAGNADRLQQVAQLGTGRVSGIAYSPDGETLAVGTPKGIALYEGGLDSTPRLLRTTPSGSYTRPIVFSPDGTHIAMIDGTNVRVWDVASSTQTTLLETDNANLNYGALEYSPDGRYIAAGGGTYRPTHMDLYVWDARTGDRVGVISNDGDDVRTLTFSPDSQSLAVITLTGVYLYSPDLTNKTTLDIPPDQNGNGLSFSPDGSLLAVGRSKVVLLWDMATNTVRQSIPIDPSTAGAFILSLSFNDDGSLLAIASQNYNISVWDLAAQSFTVPPEKVALFQDLGTIAFKPGTDIFSYISQGSTLVTQNARTGDILSEVNGGDGSSTYFAVTPDAQTIITYGFDNTIRFYDTQTGEITRKIDPSVKVLYDAILSPDGRYLAYGGYDYEAVGASFRLVSGGINLLDLQSDESDTNPVLYGNDSDSLHPFAFTNDNRLIAYDTRAYRPIYWTIGDPNQKRALSSVYIPSVYRMAISPDNRLLATVSSNQTAHLYELASSQELNLDIPAAESAQAVGFSPDGAQLAFALYDANNLTWLSVWDVETQTELYRRQFDLPASINGFRYSPDGSLIAAVGFNSLTLLDAGTGETRYQTTSPSVASYSAAFAADGHYLITSGQDGIIRLWGVPPND